MKLVNMNLEQLHPYENNPRKNDKAVDAVAASIEQCGYVAPIIVDENHVILAGHTRYKALQKLGRQEVQVIVRPGLTEEQKKKYRLLDNKTNELAEWDVDKLAEELEGLDFDDFDFGFTFASCNIDDFFDNNSRDEDKNDPKPKKIEVICPHCGEKFEYEV